VDEKNLKALWRRATARKELGLFKLSDSGTASSSPYYCL
jgi:hypothetical protein